LTPNTSSVSVAYDALGRVDSTLGYTNPLGTFLPSYVDQTNRLDHLVWPNGQRTNYTWKPNLQDQRLDSITHLDPSGQIQSQHSYSYDVEGQILTWKTTVSGAPQSTTAQYNFGYNASDELETAVQNALPAQTVQHSDSYGYDSASNRVAVTEDGKFTSYPVNTMNQLTTSSGSGPMEFRGAVSKPSTITLGGQPATVDGLNWRGWANVSPGANSLELKATETNPVPGANAQTTTRHISLTLTADVPRTFVYDNNGNMTDNGAGQTYEWDAANRLTAINYASTNQRTEFTYDGLGRRIAIYEKTNGTVTNEKHFVWDGLSIAEERDASGSVTKKFYGNGEMRGTTKLYYARDHLGSIREVTDDIGVLRARYDYTPWGTRSANAISGAVALECDFGFTGHYYHSSSQLHLAPYRAYSADLGRWLSRDPIEERDGLNLYGYVANDPINCIDLLGLAGLNLNFFNKLSDQKSINGAENYVARHANQGEPDFPNGAFVIGAHGNKFEISDDRQWNLLPQTGPKLSPEQLAAILNASNSGYHKGQPVVLYSCSTGKGNDSFAQQLAKLLGAEVIAPSDLLWGEGQGNPSIHPEGPFPGRPDTSITGAWRHFK